MTRELNYRSEVPGVRTAPYRIRCETCVHVRRVQSRAWSERFGWCDYDDGTTIVDLRWWCGEHRRHPNWQRYPLDH